MVSDLFFFLSKLLPLLVYPLGLACLLLLLAALWPGQSPGARGGVVLALLLLWGGSNPWTAMAITRSLEQRYRPPQTVPQTEVAVVLGGGTRDLLSPRPTAEIGEAGDRVLYAARLYREGVVERLLLTGGVLDGFEPAEATSGAEQMAALLRQMGVPDEALWLERRSRNTYENAVFSRELLQQEGIDHVLLITSATHMPRAVAIFERLDVAVTPMPTDFQVTDAQWQHLQTADWHIKLVYLLPSAQDLEMTTTALKEYIGIVVYGWRGWL